MGRTPRTPSGRLLRKAAAAGVLLSLVLPSDGVQKVSLFHENPAVRAAFAEKAGKKARAERAEAKAWALARGIPILFEENGTRFELRAIRDGSPLYYKTLNSSAAVSAAADAVRETSPYSVDGSGITVGVWDGGAVLTTHVELDGRVKNLDDAADHYHATHVGGTLAASGVTSIAEGMAPAVSIDSYDWNSDFTEMAAAAASAPGETNLIYLSNHSYGFDFSGTTYYGQYNSYVAELDELVYAAGYYLPFVSAGNEQEERTDGYDTISFYGVAKNVIAVGAVNDAVSGTSRSLENAGMTDFSSWGPVDDGRIKPDIVANGYRLYSSYNTSDSSYVYMSGTSMSCPSACGSAALLIDYYDDLFPGDAMRASTLKGLIIHTADDLGNAGPDYQYGWGLMNTLAAAELLADYAGGNALCLTEALLHSTTNTSDSYQVYSGGAEALRVTLCWTDPEGSATSSDDSRTPRLVNDLNLTIEGPGGTVYYPYSLDVENPSSNATAAAENDTDNVEQIYIETPAVGEYTISIDYDGTLTDGAQYYSLLTSGISSDSDEDSLPDYWESMYFGSSTAAVGSVDSDGDGADNLTEYISGYDPTNASSVFGITGFAAASTGAVPYIVTWESVAGRIYNVKVSTSLTVDPFSGNDSISGDLPYPANSYTDLVERAEAPLFYQINVRLED